MFAFSGAVFACVCVCGPANTGRLPEALLRMPRTESALAGPANTGCLPVFVSADRQTLGVCRGPFCGCFGRNLRLPGRQTLGLPNVRKHWVFTEPSCACLHTVNTEFCVYAELRFGLKPAGRKVQHSCTEEFVRALQKIVRALRE